MHDALSLESILRMLGTALQHIPAQPWRAVDLANVDRGRLDTAGVCFKPLRQARLEIGPRLDVSQATLYRHLPAARGASEGLKPKSG